ncbi:hypothetical protein NEMBOFW57_007827 [Staphylotrichum longicolle]|uniref:ATP phosphoribosyltransferase n=1 Tax=Staphylotrichum longicolle TaxID=669026 RepID=A0AAD4EV63_9PEZI|nr:hypothetical protein NEMBOFW57_007827 [Staphylotrichum longicolle]
MASALARRYKLVFHVPPPPSRPANPPSSPRARAVPPRDAANPHIGKVGELEHVEEARVETLCVGRRWRGARWRL